MNSDAFALLYKSRILTVLSFACPAVWYQYLSQNDINRLERYHTIGTNVEDLSILNLEEIIVHLNKN